MLLDECLVDITGGSCNTVALISVRLCYNRVRTLPLCVGLVNSVDNFQSLRVLGLERVEFLLQENILGGNVCENQSEAGLVGGICQSVLKDLVHGGSAKRVN